MLNEPPLGCLRHTNLSKDKRPFRSGMATRSEVQTAKHCPWGDLHRREVPFCSAMAITLNDKTRLDWFRRASAAAGIVLIACTWTLWTPQTVFPQIPLVRWAGRLPVSFDWAALAVMLASLCAMLVVRQTS